MAFNPTRRCPLSERRLDRPEHHLPEPQEILVATRHLQECDRPLAEDTAENRALIKSALNPANLADMITLKDGTTLQKYSRSLPDGTQAWAVVRNGEITNGGLNVIPR